MIISDRYIIQEYVSPDVFKAYGAKSIRFIDRQLIEADTMLVLDLEEVYGRPISCTINNWWYSGDRVASGLRRPHTPYYSITSSHAWGKGSDKIFRFKDGDREVLPTEEVYNFILEHQKRYYDAGIRRMEYIGDATSWIHWDTIWTGQEWKDKIQIVRAR